MRGQSGIAPVLRSEAGGVKTSAMKTTVSPGITRRRFLGAAVTITAASALPSVVSGSVLGLNGATPPSERVNLGLIGCGGMGVSNLNICARFPDVVVTAACDVWDARLDVITERFACKGYEDYREMLRQPDLDAVIIATPPHWHALQAIAACEAGKDVYLQKPMTLHLAESFAVRNAANRHKRICQIGTQIHAGENYRRVVEYVRSGNLGHIGAIRTFNVQNQHPNGIGSGNDKGDPKVLGLNWDLWCGPARLGPFNPTLARGSFNHSSWMAYSGGWTPGMAPHIIDLPVWALDLGYPEVTSSSGGRFALKDDGDAYDHHEVLWQYPGRTMTWMSSMTNSYGFDFHGEPAPRRRLGVYFHGTNGTLMADYDTLRIAPEGEKMKDMPEPARSIPPSPGHEREWLDCVKSRQRPSCNPDYHLRVDVPIQLSMLSLKLGRSIRFDPKKEQITGDKEAVKLSIPEYRKPWRFPREYLKA